MIDSTCSILQERDKIGDADIVDAAHKAVRKVHEASQAHVATV